MKLMLLTVVALCMLMACEPKHIEIAVPAELTLVESYMMDPEAVARGEALFIGSCSDHCHTLTPTETDASYLFDCVWNHGATDQEIFDTVYSGIPNTRMVGFGSNFPVGDQDLWKIIAYLRTKQQSCNY